MKVIKVMLVEDNREFREVLALTLGDKPDISLHSQFASADVALRDLQRPKQHGMPDLILLDLHLPGTSGLDAIPWFKRYAPQVEIIIITQSDKEADILEAIESGATGYLLKESTLNQIIGAIRSVASGGASLDPAMARYLINHCKKEPRTTAQAKLLSTRELEVLACIAKGKLQKEVAEELSISPKTIETHIRNIYEKLGVQNAPAAIDQAYKKGIFP